MDWLSEDDVLAIHEEQVAEHGGAGGLRDRKLLESALARPVHTAAYGKPDISRVAALYALGIIKNHPLIDGNKRVGAVLLETVLDLHGFQLGVTDAELVETILRVAAGEITDSSFERWIRSHVVAKKKAR